MLIHFRSLSSLATARCGIACTMPPPPLFCEARAHLFIRRSVGDSLKFAIVRRRPTSTHFVRQSAYWLHNSQPGHFGINSAPVARNVPLVLARAVLGHMRLYDIVHKPHAGSNLDEYMSVGRVDLDENNRNSGVPMYACAGGVRLGSLDHSFKYFRFVWPGQFQEFDSTYVRM